MCDRSIRKASIPSTTNNPGRARADIAEPETGQWGGSFDDALKINRNRNSIRVGADADILAGGYATIDRHSYRRAGRRRYRAIARRSAGTVPPDGDSRRVQVHIVVQRVGAFPHLARN